MMEREEGDVPASIVAAEALLTAREAGLGLSDKSAPGAEVERVEPTEGVTEVDLHSRSIREASLFDQPTEQGTRSPRVEADEGGVEAKRFGARTSGHVLVYSAAGELTFQGGITAGRGHEGANAGQQGALDGARGRSCCEKSEVYGCQLDDEECVNDR